MGDKNKLWDAVSSQDLESFLTSVINKGNSAIKEAIQLLDERQLNQTCRTLSEIVYENSETLQQNEFSTEDPISAKSLSVLKGAAVVAREILLETKKDVPASLHKAACCLHDNLLLTHDDVDLQDSVLSLCHTWWELQAPGREELVPQALPYLLIKGLTSGGASEIKKCHSMREALLLLDFDDPTIYDTKMMLLRAACHPNFLRKLEGRKFISSLFNLHPQLVRDLTTVIKNQIPSGSEFVLESYADILFRAWREANGVCLYELENSCIQDLMSTAIHASNASLFSNIECILHGFCSQKRVPGVDPMLVRLYQPILFRAFSSANPGIRRNALKLLLDAFPLTDPDASADDTDDLITKQFSAISDCLKDSAPAIRMEAVKGACSLLNLFWEIIPPATISFFISMVTGELAFDMASPAVRAMVPEGLTLLIDNPHAQPVLKRVLPQISSLLTDPSLKVRENMAKLLVAVSTSRVLHFYDIVSVNLLLDVMAHDHPEVSQKIQQVLIPSYFPNAEEGPVRVAALLRGNLEAGKSFCKLLVAGYTGEFVPPGKRVPIEHVLQLAQDLKDHLLATCEHLVEEQNVPSKKSKASKAKGSRAGTPKVTGKRRKNSAARRSDVEGVEDQQHESPSEDQLVQEEQETQGSWEALLAGLVEVCEGLGAAVKNDECDEASVNAVFEAESLKFLYEHCGTHDARSKVVSISEHLPFLGASQQLHRNFLALLMLQIEVREEDFTSILRGLSTGLTGAKLLAIIQTALGARKAKPALGRDNAYFHEPAGAAALADEAFCWICHQSDPEDSLLLCDGCPSAAHTHCLKPRLSRVPAGEWFCPLCEEEIQSSQVQLATVLELLGRLLRLPEGRALLQQRDAFAELGDALKRLSTTEHEDEDSEDQEAMLSDPSMLYYRSTLHGVLMALGAAPESSKDGQENPVLGMLARLSTATTQLLSKCRESLQTTQAPDKTPTQRLFLSLQLLADILRTKLMDTHLPDIQSKMQELSDLLVTCYERHASPSNQTLSVKLQNTFSTFCKVT